MASARREFHDGGYYHIYDRGNHRENIFRDRNDRRYFLSKLDMYCERDDISVIAYCLMNNHYHVLLRQNREVPVSHMIQSLKAGYVKVHNLKYGLEGRLFQSRYGMRKIIDNEDLLNVSRYIHRNPDVFDNYLIFRWSSIRQFIGTGDGICEPIALLELLPLQEDSYNTFVRESVSRGETVAVGAGSGSGEDIVW
jgi:putative transposase